MKKWQTLKEILSSPLTAVVNFVKGGSGEAQDAAPDIDSNADGGIYRQGSFLTTFAEKSAEAAIPLDGSQRAMNLWQRTGQMMGVQPQTGGINVTLSVPVTVNGNADKNAIQSMEAMVQTAVENAIANIQHQKERVSYG